LPVARPSATPQASDPPLYLTGRERATAIAAVEQLDLLLKTRGMAVARGTFAAAILELAHVAAGKGPLKVVSLLLTSTGLWT
jgi:hypothetical protein